MRLVRILTLASLFLLTANLESSPQPVDLVDLANTFSLSYNEWVKMEANRQAGSIDVKTLRAWEQVKKNWKELKVKVDNEY